MAQPLLGGTRIFNEVDPLKQVMVWGEPGCEALLGQLLPRSRSLFLSYYEVPQARLEFRRMQGLIESQGGQVLRAKDAFVSSLKSQDFPVLPSSLHDLELALIQKADEYFETYRQVKVSELMEFAAGELVEHIYYDVRRDIHEVLQEDADVYGEVAAIKLNYRLSLHRSLPVSNIFYGR